MLRITRLTLQIAAVAFLALTFGPGPRVSAADTDWKTLLPQAELSKLVDDSAKTVQDAVKSSSNFNLKAKATENEAYVLAIYAEAGLKSGNDELAKKSAALRDAALGLAAAAKGKDFEAAKKHAEVIAKFKTMKPDSDAKSNEVPLNKGVPIHNLMENVNSVNKEIIKYNRLTAAAFNMKGKPEEIALLSHKMAALTAAIAAHVPEKEEKAMTKKAWLEAVGEVQKATLDMAAAAKAKKQADYKAAARRMDSACTKCHDVFRVEVN